MPLTLKIDTFDLSSFVRLQPGDGYDPGANPVDPVFLDATGGEGQPLIGFNQPNKPLVWPLHVTPTKTADADTKDGLHSLVRQINLACRDAKVIEWRDDGATESTFWDVMACKFEPDHSFWKARRLWLSGTLKAWTRPYGHTGTTRILGTAGGTALSVSVPATSVIGDAAAEVDVRLQVGSALPGDGRIVGVSVVPSGYVHSWSPASMVLRNAFATVFTAATNSQASLVLRQAPVGTVVKDYPVDSFAVYLTPASSYEGRNRVIGVVSSPSGYTTATQAGIQAYDRYNRALSPARMASVQDVDGYGAVDLGVMTVDDSTATAIIQVKSSDASTIFSRLLILPEDWSTVIVDTPRRALGAITRIGTSNAALAQDDYGTRLVQSYTPIPSLADSIIEYSNRLLLASNAATSHSGGLLIDHAPYNDKVVTADVILGLQATSIIAVGVAQNEAGDTGSFAGFGRGATGAPLYLNLFKLTGNPASALPAPLACSAVPSVAQGSGRLQFRSVGSSLFGSIRTGATTVTVTTTDSSIDRADITAAVLMSLGTVQAGPGISMLTSESLPSVGIAPRNVYQITASGMIRMTSASIVTGDISGYSRGAAPGCLPSAVQNVIGFNIPLDGGPTNDLLSIDVRVRERFTYAR